MVEYDAFGYPLTHAPRAAIEPWNAAVTAFLAHGAKTPVHLAAALDAAPEFPLAHAAKGYFMLLLGRRELIGAAEEAYRAARASRLDLTARETAYVDALGDYLAGYPSRAADRLDAALARHPADALLLKLTHGVRFVLGDARGMRRSIETVLSAYGRDHPAAGYVNGCYAFALEETAAYMEAERRGRDALSLAPDDAWGLHAVAHVYDMTGRATDGVAWIARQEQAWAHCNNFAYHVAWHLALFHLDRGETGRVLELYDTRIRADKTDDYRDIANATSLLMRLEIEGVDVGARWEELAALAENRVDDGCVVFADLHYMLALAQNGGAAGEEDGAERLLTRMRASASRSLSDMDVVAHTPGAAAAEGLLLFERGDYAAAFARLSGARGRLCDIGGSHAQRDVFERVTIEAALRAGLLGEARRLLQDRGASRGAFDGYARTRLARIAELSALGGGGGAAAHVAAE